MTLARIRRGADRPAGTGVRRRSKVRSIRTRLAGLLVIPLASLVVLWMFAAYLTFDAALIARDVDRTAEQIGAPATQLYAQLGMERTLTGLVIGSGGRTGRQSIQEQRPKTDAAIAAFRKTVLNNTIKERVGPITAARLDDMLPLLDKVDSIRASVDGRRMTTLDAINAYSEIYDGLGRVYFSLRVVDDVKLHQEGRALVSFSTALDYLQREDALLAAAQVSGNRMTAAEHSAFVQWVAKQRLLYESALGELGDDLGAPVRQLSKMPEFTQVRAMEDAIVNAPTRTRVPAAAANWRNVSPKLSAAWAKSGAASTSGMQRAVEPVADKVRLQLIAAGGLGLLAVIASVVLSMLFGRRTVRELTGLQRAARELAEDRLPHVVARLRQGEHVDVQAEAPRLRVGDTTEIAMVADAFTQVQHTAIETAVGEAHLRKGISRVFLNLAWRSQSLLHRQLRMLDAMERRATDPEALEDLFRLDHLTTRMRRHAEGLVILSGAAPSRSWSKPVLLVDVLRGAIAEVEDYTRVEVATSSRAALDGAAVADIIHLLAELIENATAFSPPPTEVMVRGEMVANGFAVEVIDRGIGIPPEDLDDLNARLARPPEFDLADSDRLGLFVVARLAVRHGVKVSLQPSAYGGTTAIVLIPGRLVAQIEDFELDPPAPGRPSLAAAPEPQPWFGPQQPSPSGPDSGEIPAYGGPPTEYPGYGRGSGEYPASRPSGEYPVSRPSGEYPVQGQAPPAPVTPIFGPGSGPAPGAPAPTPAPASAEEEGRLPRRVRQANLVPQLRKSPVAPETPGEGPQERPAEESRNLIASLQAGWMRGRADEKTDDEIPFNPGKEWGES